MQTPHTAITYRPEIDGLRALAVVIVLLYHVGLGFGGGFVGVDIFFVISGFLITSLLLKDLDAGRFTLQGFYERRARRILPASLTVTAVVLVVGYFRLLPSDLEQLGRSAVAHAACAANIFFYGRATNYFGGNVANMPLLHMWSLGVEEQFYFVFPLILWGCYQLRFLRSRVALFTLLSVLFGFSFWQSVQGVYLDKVTAFFLLPSRAWELIAGAMIAIVPPARGPRGVREIISWLGLAGMVWPALAYSEATLFPATAALPPCLGAAAFIWACRGRHDAMDAPGFRQAWVGRLFAARPFVFVGAISYSLYLVHWPILVFANYWAMTPPTWTGKVMIVVASFALAIVSWRFVEQPFRRRRAGSSTWRLFAGSAAGLAVVAIMGVFFFRTDGVPSRYSEKVRQLDSVRHTMLPLQRLRPSDVVRGRLKPFGDTSPTTPVSVLLWGDSHAAAAFPAFDAVCLAHGVKGRASLYASRAPLLDYSVAETVAGREQAIAYNRAVLKYVADQHIKTVVLVNYWTRDLNAEPDPTVLDAAMGRTIDALRTLGVTTYVMLQVPAYAIEVPKGLAYEAIRGRATPAWHQTLAEHQQKQARLYAIAKKYAAVDVHFLDPATAFIQPGRPDLAVADHGRTWYMDAHHLTAFGAKRTLVPFLDTAMAFDEFTPAATTKPTK